MASRPTSAFRLPDWEARNDRNCDRSVSYATTVCGDAFRFNRR
jgi:hypothetical protein